MGPFEMVVAIILIITIGKIIHTKHKRTKTHRLLNSAETQQMQDEIAALRKRIQVLERIATDSSANDLNRQIEELRDR